MKKPFNLLGLPSTLWVVLWLVTLRPALAMAMFAYNMYCYELRATSYELRATSYERQLVSDWSSSTVRGTACSDHFWFCWYIYTEQRGWHVRAITVSDHHGQNNSWKPSQNIYREPETPKSSSEEAQSSVQRWTLSFCVRLVLKSETVRSDRSFKRELPVRELIAFLIWTTDRGITHRELVSRTGSGTTQPSWSQT